MLSAYTSLDSEYMYIYCVYRKSYAGYMEHICYMQNIADRIFHTSISFNANNIMYALAYNR